MRNRRPVGAPGLRHPIAVQQNPAARSSFCDTLICDENLTRLLAAVVRQVLAGLAGRDVLGLRLLRQDSTTWAEFDAGTASGGHRAWFVTYSYQFAYLALMLHWSYAAWRRVEEPARSPALRTGVREAASA